MKIVYISALIDENTYKNLFTKEKKPMHAANKYHMLLSNGIAKQGVSLNAFSVLPINRENCDKKYIKIPELQDGYLTYEYIPCFNIPGIRHFQLFLKSFFKVLGAQKNTIVFYDALVVAASFGAILASKIKGIKSICIVTDLPEYQNIASNKKALLINKRLIGKADGYIFLTKYMNEVINTDAKPYIVLEGHVDSEMTTKEHLEFPHNKKVLYAGSLKEIYGIGRLCDAFCKVAKENEELHIYGDGDYVPKLLKLIEHHDNIIFHGNCLNREVVEAERHVSLLVNPRPTEGVYTKFSFPSKTLEYLVSGCPVLSAKLQGIPPEYDDYLFYFDDTKDDDLAMQLRMILDLSNEELQVRGTRGREFALKNKTNVIQAKKILGFLENNF